MRGTWAAVALAMSLAACVGPGTAPSPGGVLGTSGTTMCDGADSTHATLGVCVYLLHPTAARDREPHVSVDAKNANHVLVTWREGEFSNGPKIYAALSLDDGGTWTTTRLTDPNLGPADLNFSASRYAYDSTSAFGPDGAAYVLMGGENTYVDAPARATQLYGTEALTLATSRASTWSYHRFFSLPTGTAGADYPDLAVDPDTGRLLAVAQVYDTQAYNAFPVCRVGLASCTIPLGIWLSTSDDQGATWSNPAVVVRNYPSAPAGSLPFYYLPRVKAGHEGAVVITLNGGDPFGAFVLVSHDHGASFTAPTRVLTYASGDGSINDPVAFMQDAGKTRLDLLYTNDHDVTLVTSPDMGATFSQPSILGHVAANDAIAYAAASGGPNGTAALLLRAGNDAHFTMEAFRWHLQGRVDNLTLVSASGVNGTWEIGDDYGAVAMAPDGSTWASWADLPTSGGPLAVAHIPAGSP
ncbi:MAG: sialidase family protein [Thermoplasmatota archaeon]